MKIKVFRKRGLDEEESASSQLFLTAFSGYAISRKSPVFHTGKPGDTNCMKTVGYIFIIVDRPIFSLSTTFCYSMSTKSKKKYGPFLMSVVFRNNRDLSSTQAQSLTLGESNTPPYIALFYVLLFP